MTDPDAAAFGAVLAALAERGAGRMVPDLERIARLCALLGDPQLAAPVVHVTATNGKGSVSRMVAALSSAVGLTTGTHTSPHLIDVRERLSVGGEPISRAAFAEVHAEVEALAALVDAELAERDGPGADRVTYFELITAMAFAWFADVPVDLAVIEVGMGGRWDATNVARAEVAVIGEVALDHRELGSTPAEVAMEKVGIIEPGSIVVTAAQGPDVERVVAAAVADAGATRWSVGQDLVLVARRPQPSGQELDVEVRGRRIDRLVLPLFGAHQARNALLALGAFAAVLGERFDAVDDGLVRAGLAAVRVPGRLERVADAPLVVVDGAHNPHAAVALAVALGDGEVVGRRPVTLLLGVLADKDVEGIVAGLAGIATTVVTTTAPDERALAAEELAAIVRREAPGAVVEAVTDPGAALERARELAGPLGAVVATGSLRTVGAVRQRLVGDGEHDRLARVVPLVAEDASHRTLVVGLDG
ncbi:MAG: hypothetical protein RLZZ272_1738, partial [Actinomycetota bacterium]